MPYFALFYEVVDDFVGRRASFRNEHLRLAGEANSRGDLLLGGALVEPADAALLVFNCANKLIVEGFAKRDPYVVNGLVRKWTVRPWNVVVGQNAEPVTSSSGRLQ
jgi:uncharacterized protein